MKLYLADKREEEQESKTLMELCPQHCECEQQWRDEQMKLNTNEQNLAAAGRRDRNKFEEGDMQQQYSKQSSHYVLLISCSQIMLISSILHFLDSIPNTIFTVLFGSIRVG